MDKKHKAEVDVAVLILFFNRPEPLRQVFAQIRQARPAHLYLYQDGPRGERDMAGIEACRKVVADGEIDWECDVRRNYQTVNAGCDPSNYNAQRWAFSLSDKVVVFEDDSIPSVSFIRFCKVMLDRYADDSRVCMISGLNIDEVSSDVPYDYFFTSVCSIWGWASWRRVIDQWDATYSFLDDDFNMRQMRAIFAQRKMWRGMLRMCQSHRKSGKAYYESLFWTTMVQNSGLAIVPRWNMINNLGPTDGSVHYQGQLRTMPRRQRQVFTMKRHEMRFPLNHPRYVMENVAYKERFYRVHAWEHPWLKVRYSLEELWLNLRYGNFRTILKAIRNRIGILAGGRKFH